MGLFILASNLAIFIALAVLLASLEGCVQVDLTGVLKLKIEFTENTNGSQVGLLDAKFIQ